MKVSLGFKLADLWIGVYYERRTDGLHLWVCLLPCAPVHLFFPRKDSPVIETLVRDSAKEWVMAKPVEARPQIRHARYDEMIPLLRAKLEEELEKMDAAQNRSGFLEEVADLIEVAESLAYFSYEASPGEVELFKRDKRERRGGFNRMLVMERHDKTPKIEKATRPGFTGSNAWGDQKPPR